MNETENSFFPFLYRTQGNGAGTLGAASFWESSGRISWPEGSALKARQVHCPLIAI